MFVFLADCKAAAIATRAQIQRAGGIYCFPLPLTGQNPALLNQWVLDPPSASLEIRLPKQNEDEPAIGKGFEVELGKFWLNPDTKRMMTWHDGSMFVTTLSSLHRQILSMLKLPESIYSLHLNPCKT
jgi:hypothetical protein